MADSWDNYAAGGSVWIDAMRLQLRVLAALVRREMGTHFGESRLGYLWALIEPAAHLMMLVVVFTYIFRRRVPITGSMPLFFLTGLVPYFLYYKVAGYLTSAVDSNKPLLNLPPVKPLDVLLSRAILESATYLVVAVVLLTGLFLSGVPQAIPSDGLTLAAAVGVIVMFGTGVGMINAVMSTFLNNWGFFFYVFLGPLYLLSGIFFLPEEVPPPWRDYLLYNPIVHYIEWFREAFYPGYSSAYLYRGYAFGWSAAVLTIGFALVRVMRRRLLEPT